MGNCISPASKARPHGGDPMLPAREEDMEEWCFASPDEAATTTIGRVLREEEEKAAEETAAAGVKVKVVLKRAELEWLMAQLKTGDRRLEDVLHQMGTARLAAAQVTPTLLPRSGAGDGWRPRLECILECHELAAT